jgi:hypothetical protein
MLRAGGRLLAAVHAGDEVQRFTEYKGVPVEVELHLRDPSTFAGQIRDAGFSVESVEVLAPYPFEHPGRRLYVSARAEA